MDMTLWFLLQAKSDFDPAFSGATSDLASSERHASGTRCGCRTPFALHSV